VDVAFIFKVSRTIKNVVYPAIERPTIPKSLIFKYIIYGSEFFLTSYSS